MPPLQGCLPGLEASELRLLALFVFILVMVSRSVRCPLSMALRFLEPLFVCGTFSSFYYIYQYNDRWVWAPPRHIRLIKH